MNDRNERCKKHQEIETIRYKSLESVKIDGIKFNTFYLAKVKQNLIKW
jgi:hypothetical protein